jgi:hypothetical protein
MPGQLPDSRRSHCRQSAGTFIGSERTTMNAVSIAMPSSPTSTLRRKSPQLVFLLLAVLTALSCYTLTYRYFKPIVLQANPTVDFSCFYRAGQMAVEGDGSRIYDIGAQQEYDRRLGDKIVPGKWIEFRPFPYPPFVLIIYGPLAYLPYHQAELTWFWLNVGLLLVVPFALGDLLGQGKLLAAAIVATAVFLPIEFALIQGQNSIVPLFFMALAVAELRKGHDLQAGCFMAFAMWKPQLAIPMVLALFVAGNWKAVRGFLSASLALFGVSVAIVGWKTTIGFPRAVARFTQIPTGFGGDYAPYMANVRGMLYLLLHPRISDPHLQILVMAISSLLIVAAAVVFRSCSDQPYELRCALLLAVTALTSHHYYLHDMSVLLLAFLLCLGYIHGRPLRWNLVVLMGIAASFYVIPFSSASYQRTIVYLFAATVMFTTTLMIEIVSSKVRIGVTTSALPSVSALG